MHDEPSLAAGKHKNPFKRFWMEHSFTIISYFTLIILILIVYHGFSDGDFSFLMTLGSVFNMFSFALLVVKAVWTKRVANISLKTLQCYAVLITARLCSILRYEGYLPYDKSGDFVYQATEVITLILVVGLLVSVGYTFRRSYSERADKFGSFIPQIVPAAFGAVWLVVPALVLAVLLHPSLNNNFYTDTAWAFALYLEAVAIFPQIYLMNNIGGAEIDPFESNFVFGVFVARTMHFVFWLSSYHELNDKYTSHFGRKYPGHLVVLSQIVNLFLMGDFCYYYMSASRRKEQFILPSTL